MIGADIAWGKAKHALSCHHRRHGRQLNALCLAGKQRRLSATRTFEPCKQPSAHHQGSTNHNRRKWRNTALLGKLFSSPP